MKQVGTKMENEYDLTPEELEELGISPFDYAEAGEVCMEFLTELDEFSGDLVDLATRILDEQTANERFSETLARIGG
jgi:hypothetical protein